MSTIFGIAATEIRPQPGFTATQAQEGGWTGTHTFAIRRSAWNRQFIRDEFRIGRSITELDISLSMYFEFLEIASLTILSDEGDFMMIQTNLAGGKSSQYLPQGSGTEESRPVYRLTCSLQDAPISEHPKWKLFSDIEREALSNMISGDLVFDEYSSTVGTRDERSFWVESNSEGTPYIIEGADAIEFAKLIAGGQTTYQRPAMVWTESRQGNSGLTFDQIQKLGKIDNPSGSPPEPSGVRDWMLTSAFDEETGGLHRTELEWTMSEAGGFNTTLYEE